MPIPQDSQRRWYAIPLLALGAVGFAAAWLLLAVALDRQCSWMAPLAALDMALLLRLGRWPAGISRCGWMLAATAAVIAAANFLIAAGQLGKSMGMRPWESALRIGPDYAWLLIQLANDRIDIGLYAASLLLAAWLGLRGGASGRHPVPSAH